MVRSPHDLGKQLRVLKDFCSNTGMTVNTDKTKVMIIKSDKITYDTFVYDNNNLEEVTSYKYLGIDKLNWNYSIEKRIIGGWKTYYELENNCQYVDLYMLIFGYGIRRNSSLRLCYTCYSTRMQILEKDKENPKEFYKL
jgi:hypothetical protein